MSTLWGIGLGIIILFAVIFIIYKIIDMKKSHDLEGINDVYIGRLENTDSSIQNAMKYLELKNGIMQNYMEN